MFIPNTHKIIIAGRFAATQLCEAGLPECALSRDARLCNDDARLCTDGLLMLIALSVFNAVLATVCIVLSFIVHASLWAKKVLSVEVSPVRKIYGSK
ncbi:MAG: hypothetical protein LBH06_04020 [Rikenellaceae bacterium]|nr:hypothetical protein [Rikenellaceae bacterium]